MGSSEGGLLLMWRMMSRKGDGGGEEDMGGRIWCWRLEACETNANVGSAPGPTPDLQQENLDERADATRGTAQGPGTEAPRRPVIIDGPHLASSSSPLCQYLLGGSRSRSFILIQERWIESVRKLDGRWAGAGRAPPRKRKLKGQRIRSRWPAATDGRYQDYKSNPNMINIDLLRCQLEFARDQ